MSDPNQELKEFIKNLKFKKKLVGGVDEVDVWNKLEAIEKEYQRLLDIQKAKYEAIIAYKKAREDERG